MFDELRGGTTITIAILTLLTLAIIVRWALTRRARAAVRARRDIPLFIPTSGTPADIPRPTIPRGTAIDAADAGGHGGSRAGDSGDEPGSWRAARFAPPAPVIRTRDGSVSTLSRASRDDRGVTDDEVSAEFAPLPLRRPADGTLQVLPGRLEIASGTDAGQEIRFVRTPGPDGTRVTFGRADGVAYRHVQLRAPTVSRVHARMTLESGGNFADAERGGSGGGARWRLDNLSATNPVIVNGRTLQSEGHPGSSVILTDGDRIEMGEVAFVFRAR